MTLIRDDSQEQIEKQSPSVGVVMPGKFGEITVENVSLQNNYQSATVILTAWVEGFFIPHSFLNYLSNCGLAFTLGVILIPLTSLSPYVGIALIPPVFIYFGLGYMTQGSKLEGAFWLYTGLAILGFLTVLLFNFLV